MKNILMLGIGLIGGFAAATFIFRSKQAGVLHIQKDPDFGQPMLFLEILEPQLLTPGSEVKMQVVEDPQN